MLITIYLSAIWFFCFMATQLTVFRLFKNTSRAKVIANTFKITLLGLLFSVGVCNYLYTGEIINYILAFCIFFSLFILYTPFYYTVATSLSVQSLIMLNKSHKSSMPINDLSKKFVSEDLIAKRLDLMVKNGHLIKVDGKYKLQKKGAIIAKYFLYLKNIWRLGSGG